MRLSISRHRWLLHDNVRYELLLCTIFRFLPTCYSRKVKRPQPARAYQFRSESGDAKRLYYERKAVIFDYYAWEATLPYMCHIPMLINISREALEAFDRLAVKDEKCIDFTTIIGYRFWPNDRRAKAGWRAKERLAIRESYFKKTWRMSAGRQHHYHASTRSASRYWRQILSKWILL